MNQVNEQNPALSSQPEQSWSYETLRHCQPTPDRFQRSYAEEWNNGFPAGHELRVNPADFPVELPTRSPQEIEETWQWLRDLSNGHQRPNPRFSGQ